MNINIVKAGYVCRLHDFRTKLKIKHFYTRHIANREKSISIPRKQLSDICHQKLVE